MAPEPLSSPIPWREQASCRLYRALAWLAQPLLRRKLRRRGESEPGYLEQVDERFGRYEPAVRAAFGQRGAGPRIWIHAVSLGETRAAAILIAALRARWPRLQLVLTHGTATGRAEGRRLLRPDDLQLWLPWDTAAAVAGFLEMAEPDLGLIMETEVWPNLMRACAARQVPMALVNARLNEKSMRGALRWPALMAPAYRRFTCVLAQTEADAERLRAVGAASVLVTGNLKYDIEIPAAQLARARAWRQALQRPVALLASSREGEELALLQALQAQPEAAGGIQWLIVPRHPQRFDAVAQLAQRHGWIVSRRSAWTDGGGPVGPGPAHGRVLWLGDSLGEMALYYGLADAALLGGSFEPLGGQNLIEAAACGCPLLMGPHTFNFAEAAALALAEGAARRVVDLPAAVQAARELLVHDRAALQAMQRAASELARQRRGAAAAIVGALAPLVPRA